MTLAQRLPLVDVARGVAVVLMVIYHGCFDLNWYGIAQFHLNSAPFWLIARAAIVTLFLLVMGISVALAPLNWPSFHRRLARLVGAALLVTGASIWLFPHSYIYFGVLHFAAVASVLTLPLRSGGWLSLGMGVGVVVAGFTVHHPLFDQPAWHWLGMMTFKPRTEDYVPLVPWLGVVLMGIGLGNQWRKALQKVRFIPQRLAPLAWLGRHSLGVYLVHQPLLLGGFGVMGWIASLIPI